MARNHRSKPHPKDPVQRPGWLKALPVIVIGLGLVIFAGWSLLKGSSKTGKAVGTVEATMVPGLVKTNLKADKDLVDLGDVKLGNPVKVSFEITNTADQPIEIIKQPYVEAIEGC